jgi:hypothetical protein
MMFLPSPNALPNAETNSTQGTAVLRDFEPVYVAYGSDPVIRRCRLNVRFARKRTRLGDLEYTP